jgi:cytochrome c
VEEMVKYILSLANEKGVDKKPLKSSYVTQAKKKDGSYIFTASYTDKGNGAMGPLTGSKTIALRPSTLMANMADTTRNTFKYKGQNGNEMVIGMKDGGFLAFDDIDLTEISKLAVSVSSMAGRSVGGTLEVRLDGVAGAKIGEGKVDKSETISIPVKSPADGKLHKVYFVFKNPDAGNKPLFSVESIQFENAVL